MENPYKYSNSIDSSPTRAGEDDKERVLKEAAEACKNDPEIKKEIEKAN